MGFRKEWKQYKLIFQDQDLEGFVCLCKSLSVDQFMELSALADLLTSPGTRSKDNITKVFEFMSDSIIEWNLEDEEGKPVPTDVDSIKEQEFDFITTILNSWMSAMAGVPSPLPKGSPNGETSQGAMITELANSSQSLTN